MKEKFIFFLFLFTNFILSQNVIVVVIDGARYTETFGGGSANIPHMYNDMMPSGYLYTNYWIAHEGKTETNPGHASILSGTWQQIANDGSQRPTYPTVFEYIRKEDGNPQSDCYAVTGKDKLDILTYSVFSGYGSAYCGTWVGDDNRDDALTYSKAISVMQDFHPKILLINFAGVDVAAHSGNWNNYLTAITNADNLVYQLWQTIQNNIYGYTPQNTTLFVTNDHGRHTTNFSSHGDDCEGCEHIMLFVIGRNVSQGIVNNDMHYQVDIAPTIGDLLGFSTPHAVGISLYQGSNPLPVELSSFTAKILKSGGVQLNWRTETEVSNYGFEIERASSLPDGKAGSTTPLQDWMKIGFVEGHGNSNSPKKYSFIDDLTLIPNHTLYYRLKQIDTDGQFEYSKIIEVDAGNIPEGFMLEQNYPNPFNPGTIIKFALAETQKTELKIYDVLGNEVAILFKGIADGGKVYELEFNSHSGEGQNLSSGLYLYRLATDNRVENRKMLLLK